MKQLAEFPGAARARIRGVFCDIDDTLTTGGKLTAAAYAALETLQRAGLLVVPITGRPAGWCDQIARMWPVHAVVGENGAFYFRYDHAARRMRRRYVDDAATRAGHRERLLAGFTDVGGNAQNEDTIAAAIEQLQSGVAANLAFSYRGNLETVSPMTAAEVPERFDFVQRPVQPAGEEECY